MTDSLTQLSAPGVAIWLDVLSRQRLTGGLEELRRDQHVFAVTTNPSIFASTTLSRGRSKSEEKLS